MTDARTLYPLADCNGVEVYDGDRIESRSTKRIATLRYRKDDRKWTVDIGGHVRPFIPHNEEGRLLGWKLYQPVHVDPPAPPPVKVSTPEQEAAIDAAVGIRGLPPIRLDLDVYALAAENAAREGLVLQAYVRRVLTEFLRGSIPGRQPDGHAYMYPDGLRFSNAERINGAKPVRSVPYYLGWPSSTRPLPMTRVLASGTINGKREELRGWYEDDLKAWQAGPSAPTDAETRLAFERRFSARDLTPASDGFDGYKDDTTDAMVRAWAEAVRWCLNRPEKAK